MKLGAIVPHLLPFGGIRRFLEVGNVLLTRGHDYTVFAKKPEFSGWMDYAGAIADWRRIDADILLIGDPPSFPVLANAQGVVYIWVLAGGMYLRPYQDVADNYRLLLNSRLFAPFFPNARLCEGGVNTDVFHPRPRRVGYYAGRGATKGESTIVNALSGLPSVVLVPLQGLTTPQLVVAYHSLDYFVCAEERPGWPNTAAEALACGIPVVSTSRNTTPFGDRVIQTDDLRQFFAAPMQHFSWESTCTRLEEIWREDGFRA